MKANPSYSPTTLHAEQIRVRGIVQGVGFRPAVWKIAQQFQLTGSVSNDGDGVLITVFGEQVTINGFVDALVKNKPALSRIDTIERLATELSDSPPPHFEIIHSTHSAANTGITADAATCEACLQDVFGDDITHDNNNNGNGDRNRDGKEASNRRHCYPFTNCTHCGPRLSIIKGIPYDRAQTSMHVFNMCPACLHEYKSPDDRRFHAQPNACPECGPTVWLEDNTGKIISSANKELDYHDMPIVQAALFIREKAIIAIKGLGGIHLAVCACEDPSSKASAVETLRERKKRPRKPFAIMVKNIAMAKQYCHVNQHEQDLLISSAAPIVLLQKRAQVEDGEVLAEAIAPGQKTLGVMLPYTPLHHQLLRVLNKPIVLTSGNEAHAPQCIDNNTATSQLKHIADYFLLHDRDIVNRVDDSVVRLMDGKPQFYRRARGYAPEFLTLPKGFIDAPDVLAMGGELKNTFCLLKKGQATLSQHMGDLENYSTYKDYQHNLTLYETLFQHRSKHIVIDDHPEYIPSKLGIEMVDERNATLHRVQHHHAHLASCLAENAYALNDKPVLGVILDGLGYGLGHNNPYKKHLSDHPLWGGEFLFSDYRKSTKLAHFKPVALLGGSAAMKEPWRNTYAHLQACLGWQWVSEKYPQLELVQALSEKPLTTYDAMLEKNVNCPLASSAGRLFDAVAAAAGICRESIQYEGQAAIELEASITPSAWSSARFSAYPFASSDGILDPTLLWKALLKDLANSVNVPLIAARFHKGLSVAIQQLTSELAFSKGTRTIVLSGGVFQNKTLFEDVKQGLEQMNFTVLHHRHVPANDGGLALGQAVIAAARLINEESNHVLGNSR